ncbi:hypothetical protein GCM10007977_001250 [Dactylosporangium sucinum]|uniref:Uncharacterized protein n=1 Tax=Dactylosporangium sucinum TaxID=1424081 RepID=A0A917T099_9ACTN|nr:hypothetical protein GCM10007977_001250 [Dactylosporangium sucinum]
MTSRSHDGVSPVPVSRAPNARRCAPTGSGAPLVAESAARPSDAMPNSRVRQPTVRRRPLPDARPGPGTLAGPGVGPRATRASHETPLTTLLHMSAADDATWGVGGGALVACPVTKSARTPSTGRCPPEPGQRQTAAETFTRPRAVTGSSASPRRSSSAAPAGTVTRQAYWPGFRPAGTPRVTRTYADPGAESTPWRSTSDQLAARTGATTYRCCSGLVFTTLNRRWSGCPRWMVAPASVAWAGAGERRGSHRAAASGVAPAGKTDPPATGSSPGRPA